MNAAAQNSGSTPHHGSAPVPGSVPVGPKEPRTTAAQRLKALGRAELTLLSRNRTGLFAALFVPVVMVATINSSLDRTDLGTADPRVTEVAMTGGIGMVLLLAVYCNLVAAYTSRREELVLKRLRAGETSDAEILAGTALPAAALAVAQSAVMIVAGCALLGIRAPQRPESLLLGMTAALVMLTALAAATSVYTRTAESAQLTTMPLFLVSALGSGAFIPLEILPDRIASFCELLPFTGVMTLIQAGWLGGTAAYDLLGAALGALAWIALALFAVRRWFRWEPRR